MSFDAQTVAQANEIGKGAVYGGVIDPSVDKFFAAKGSLYIRLSTDGVTPVSVYQKQDNGYTDAWTVLGSGGTPVSNNTSHYFGGYVNDDGPLKTAIALKKASVATVVENTGSTVALQALINAAVSGDIIEIQHNGPYSSVLIPSGVSMTIRAGAGFLPVFTALNALRLANNVSDFYLIGVKFLNCTTADANAKGSAITFDTVNYKVNGLYVSNCIFEKCTGSAVNLSYHMTIGGDNYANPYLLTDLSTNVNFVDCRLLRAGTDIIEGACLMLRGMNGATIRRCYSDTGDGSDPWAGEGRPRSFQLQYAINSVIEDCTAKKLLAGAQENYKLDQLSAGLSTFKNQVIVRRCFSQGAVEGFDNDDQGIVEFSECAAYLCTKGINMGKATSEGTIVSCIVAKCDYGVSIAAAVLAAKISIQNNQVFLSNISDYQILNNYVLNTNNLQGSRPSLLSLFLGP